MSRGLLLCFIFALSANALVLPLTEQKKAAAGKTLCSLCEDFAAAIKEAVDQHSPDLEQNLLNLCSKFFAFSSLLEGQCKMIVSQDLDAIVKAVDDNFTPLGFCNKFLHIC